MKNLSILKLRVAPRNERRMVENSMGNPLHENVILLNFVFALRDAGFKMEDCFWCQMNESGRPGKNKLYAVVSDTFGVTPEEAEQWWSCLMPRSDRSGEPMASAVLNFLVRKQGGATPDQLASLKGVLGALQGALGPQKQPKEP